MGPSVCDDVRVMIHEQERAILPVGGWRFKCFFSQVEIEKPVDGSTTETAARNAERLATPISLLNGHIILSRPKDDDVSSASPVVVSVCINLDQLCQNQCCNTTQ